MASLIIRSLFEDTYSPTKGGAIYRDSGTLQVLYSTFLDSVAEEEGGCIYVTNLDSFQLYSVCGFCCRVKTSGENEWDDKGGNFYVSNTSPTTVDFTTAYKCAPSTSEGGDSVIYIHESTITLSNANCTNCNGRQGGCMGGYEALLEGCALSRVLCRDCEDFGLITTVRSDNPVTISDSVFIANVLDRFMIMATTDYAGNFFRSCGFFRHANTQIHGAHDFVDCVSDTAIPGCDIGTKTMFALPMRCFTLKPPAAVNRLERFSRLSVLVFVLKSE